MSETISQSELLKEVQQHARSPEQDIDNVVQELLTLASVVHNNPKAEGVNLGALGGIQYCIERLHEAFGAQQPLDKLKERYASVELTSYPASEEEVESMRAMGKREGVFLRDIPIVTADGRERHVFCSHMNQTTVGGRVLAEGEFIHSPSRFPPPFSFLLQGTPYMRGPADGR